MEHAKVDQSVDQEMRIGEGFTIQELEQRLEMFYCCGGAGGGLSCGTGEEPR